MDLVTWARLSLYFAEKLRAGVVLHTFRTGGDPEQRTAALGHLERALGHWQVIGAAEASHYRPVQDIAATLSWSHYGDQVRRDIEIAESAEGPQASDAQP
jgi:hypothetical protein